MQNKVNKKTSQNGRYTIQQFPSWFSKQKLIGKLAVGCAGLFVLCCLCSVPYSILNPSTPRLEGNNTSVPEISSTLVVTQTENPTEIFSPTATFESYISLLSCAGSGGIQNNGQYFNDFCLASGLLLDNPEKLEMAMREFCINKQTEFCDVNAWASKENVPESYPMTDSQIATQLAQYKKNGTTGYDCFILFKNGEQAYASSGCSQ